MSDDNVATRQAMDSLRNEIDALERRLRTMRTEVERAEQLPATMEVLACVMGDSHVGVPLSSVEHVVGIARLCPARDAVPWICGLLDLHGVMIPVVDVGVRLGNPPRKLELSDLIAICTTRQGRVGLWVESVFGVIRIQTAALDRDVPEIIGAPHLLGLTVVGGKATYLLRLDALLGTFERTGGQKSECSPD